MYLNGKTCQNSRQSFIPWDHLFNFIVDAKMADLVAGRSMYK